MPRILLIDDDEDLAPPLAAYLKRFDFELDSATRPSSGLARLRAGNYDAVILDVMLPEIDGFELCRRVRKESDIPVLMLTARGDVTDRVVGLELAPTTICPSGSSRASWRRACRRSRRAPRGCGAASPARSTACDRSRTACSATVKPSSDRHEFSCCVAGARTPARLQPRRDPEPVAGTKPPLHARRRHPRQPAAAQARAVQCIKTLRNAAVRLPRA
jgi:CheY-like chemotaxis protein